jgi:MSHA biogenesis protein MshP
MKPRSAHDGFAALAAIFLMVVLGALGAFMLSFSTIQHSTSAQDIQGSRAYWAARAGLEWGLANFASACPGQPVTLIATQQASSSPFTLFGFGVTVTCSLTGYAESTPTPTIPNVFIYQFDVVAKSSTAIGSQGYFERSVSASMER